MKNFSLQASFNLKDNSSGGDAGSGKTESAIFEGIAYTGDVVTLYGDSYVFDLSSTTANAPIAALVNHDSNQRAGVITASVITDTLAIKGSFLPNDHGMAVQSESKAGFPWQMSVGISARSVERLESGTTSVNGRVINAPAYICRNCRINEISFVPVGADTNTTAKALSAQQVKPTMEANAMSEDAAKYQTQLSQVQAELQVAQVALAAEKTKARAAQIKQLADNSKLELTADQTAALSGLDDAQFEQISSLISSVAAGHKATSASSLLSHDIKPDDGGSSKQELSADNMLLKLAKGA
ncbi:hypothetical protein VSS37_03410 [Candidatus Thiothrix sp. Deng01]|uniref:HK97 family phage prohead protease n=1 Tax=Candidatus Thiothrix phosphatis TaxID=3112415 RepID=A0ABU6CUG7_9GAMM|nr:hypothetical protein [Candidatus Thiothrix sp. Deng01]MEB4590018.1 hypothetical protein [Candidatus Thiothrix sp. Deng01]